MQEPLQSKTARDYLKVIFKRSWMIALIFVVTCSVVLVGNAMKTPVYEAKVKMLIAASKTSESPHYKELSGYSSGEKITYTQSEIVKSTPVLQRAADALDLEMRPDDYEMDYASPLKQFYLQWSKDRKEQNKTAAEIRKEGTTSAIGFLKKNISVEPVRDTNTFNIKVRDYDPQAAAAIANAVSRSYVIFDLEQQLAEVHLKYGSKHPYVRQLSDNIDRMYKTLDGGAISNVVAIGPATVKIIEQASAPALPVKNNNKVALLLAAMMSLGLGVILAFIFDLLDPTLRTPDDTRSALQLPLIGFIEKARWRRPDVTQKLVDQVYLTIKKRNLKTIVLTPVEGRKSQRYAIAELAKHFATRGGKNVLVIDADFEKPFMHKRFRAELKPGLSDVLRGKIALKEAIKAAHPGLSVLPAGKTEAGGIILLDSPLMQETLIQCRDQFDLIFINAPALSITPAASILSSHADGTLVILDEGKTRREVAKAALAEFSQQEEKMVGAILSNRTFPVPKFIYDSV